MGLVHSVAVFGLFNCNLCEPVSKITWCLGGRIALSLASMIKGVPMHFHIQVLDYWYLKMKFLVTWLCKVRFSDNNEGERPISLVGRL